MADDLVFRCTLCGKPSMGDVTCCGRPAVPVGEDGTFRDGCPIPCSECDRTEPEKESCDIRKRRMGVETFICDVCEAEYETVGGDARCPVCGDFGRPRRKPDDRGGDGGEDA
jgi:hypothetical protein